MDVGIHLLPLNISAAAALGNGQQTKPSYSSLIALLPGALEVAAAKHLCEEDKWDAASSAFCTRSCCADLLLCGLCAMAAQGWSKLPVGNNSQPSFPST